jgi:hypothetical protein
VCDSSSVEAGSGKHESVRSRSDTDVQLAG